MRYFLLLVTFFVLMAAQSSFLGLFGLGAYSVDLPLIAVMYLASTSSRRRMGSFITAVAIGFLADSFAVGSIFGIQMEIAGLLFLSSMALANRFQWHRVGPLMALTLVGTIISSALFYLLSFLFDEGFSWHTFDWLGLFVRILVTTLASPLLFRLFGLFDGRSRGRTATSSLLR
ncbi:MAG: hypothetical protein ACOX51_01790 [Myxococcota bacterium]|jgi:hypothetical protein|nr:hypothetical protein [Myxococcota bacterium]HQC44948.1 hypothetical protein [Myxococcota bacterium]HQL57456.1 hypothetical protein [Myxococcota bacterium]